MYKKIVSATIHGNYHKIVRKYSMQKVFTRKRTFFCLVFIFMFVLTVIESMAEETIKSINQRCEKNKIIAIEKILNNPQLLRNPDMLEGINRPYNLFDYQCLNVQILGNFLIFIIQDPTAKPGEDILVGLKEDDGTFFINENNFNDIILLNNTKISTNDQAYSLVKLYLSLFGNPFPRSYKYLRILDSFNDIVWENSNNITDYIKGLVKPASVEKDKRNYIISLFTWSPIGGDLIYWKFYIDFNGEMTVHKEIIKSNIGQNYLPE